MSEGKKCFGENSSKVRNSASEGVEEIRGTGI